MKFFIPENLNVDLLLKVYPPSNISKFKKERLLYILHLITYIPANNKDLELVDDFVPIYSPLLQKKVRNYRQYLDYLVHTTKVFLCNNRYEKGARSKGYKFNPMYSRKVVPATIDCKKFRVLSAKKPLSARTVKQYKHLLKWYNEDLHIDHDLAMRFIDVDLARKLADPMLRDDNPKSKGKKDPFIQYNQSLCNIERIRHGEFLPFVDPNVFRFHSTITNLKSEIRNCISYGGRQLVSIDIKNSQPYLSTGVLKSGFYNPSSIFNLYNIKGISLKDIFYSKSELTSYVTLCNFEETQARLDLQQYITFVQNGTLYEYLAESFKNKLGISFSDRSSLKGVVFQVLFTDNRFMTPEKRLFKQLFPTVYELYSLIKKHNKTNLPRLLQCIESHLMLRVITKRVSNERPNLPILTIHDSIVTTTGNEGYVASVLKEEMEKAIGVPPELSYDYWYPSNMKFNDGTPFIWEQEQAA